MAPINSFFASTLKSAFRSSTKYSGQEVVALTEKTSEDVANLLARAKYLKMTPERYSELGKLREATQKLTATPEEVVKNAALKRDLLIRGANGNNVPTLYSRTFINSEGALEKTLSNGDRVVIRDLGNGQTSRKVYRGGKLMVDDLKILSTDLSYPGKIVRNKHFDRIVRESWYDRYNSIQQDFLANKFDYTAKRVYLRNGQDAQLVGMKEIEKSPMRVISDPYNMNNEVNLSNSEVYQYNPPETTWETKTIPNENARYRQETSGTRKEFAGTGPNKRVIHKDDYLNNPTNRTPNEAFLKVGSYKPVYNAQVTPIKDCGGYNRRTGEYIHTPWPHTDYNGKGIPIPKDLGFSYRGNNDIKAVLVSNKQINKLPPEWQNTAIDKTKYGVFIPIDNMSAKDMIKFKNILCS